MPRLPSDGAAGKTVRNLGIQQPCPVFFEPLVRRRRPRRQGGGNRRAAGKEPRLPEVPRSPFRKSAGARGGGGDLRGLSRGRKRLPEAQHHDEPGQGGGERPDRFRIARCGQGALSGMPRHGPWKALGIRNRLGRHRALHSGETGPGFPPGKKAAPVQYGGQIAAGFRKPGRLPARRLPPCSSGAWSPSWGRRRRERE